MSLSTVFASNYSVYVGDYITIVVDDKSNLQQILDSNNITYDVEANEFEVDRTNEAFIEQLINTLEELKQQQTKEHIVIVFPDDKPEYSIQFKDEVSIHTSGDEIVLGALEFNEIVETIIQWFPEFQRDENALFLTYKMSGGIEAFKLIAKKITQSMDLEKLAPQILNCYKSRTSWQLDK